MMRQGADQSDRREAEEMYGRLLHTRVKKMDRVPTQFKQTFLRSVSSTVVFDNIKEVDSSIFAWALMIDATTPLPQEANFRHEGLLLKACQEQYLKLGSVLNFDLSDLSAHSFNFFGMDGTSAATFLPNKHKISLPGGEGMNWQLDSPEELHCIANSTAFKGCSQKLLPLVPGFEDYDPSAPWPRRASRPRRRRS